MSKLKAIDPQTAEPTKPKTMIFGGAGVGKTWGALDFPSVYYFDTEGGANRAHYTDKLKKSGGAYFGIEQGSQSFGAMIEQVQALATEDHHYKTIVIDSGTKIYEMARAEAAETDGDAFGRDKKEANKPARRLMHWLQKVDMNVIIICHEIPLWGKDNKGERSQIGVTYDCWPKLDYDLDLALNIQKQGPRRLARITKSRLLTFGEGENFEWSYANFAERYGREIIERDSVKIALATPEQIDEFTRLIKVVKLDEENRTDKMIIENQDSIPETEEVKVTKIINYLKKKVNV
jgi:hypothetical protein